MAASKLRSNPNGWPVDPARGIRIRYDGRDETYRVEVNGDIATGKSFATFPTALLAVVDMIVGEAEPARLPFDDGGVASGKGALAAAAGQGRARARAVDLLLGRMARFTEGSTDAPGSASGGDTITAEVFEKMSDSERIAVYHSNPATYREMMGHVRERAESRLYGGGEEA